MSPPEIAPDLAAISGGYELALCDVWGVIHNGRESFASACAALATFQRTRGPVILISNSPRPSSDVVAQLRSLGVPDEAWSALVTSGDVTREALAARAPGPAWKIGPDRDDTLYEGLGLEFAGPDEAAFISCTGLYDDTVETPEDYREVLALAAARGIEMVCANPDLRVQRGDALVWCAGALAELYTAMGGRAATAGKPFAPIYDSSFVHAERLLGRPVRRERVLAIGDGLLTDVAGANAQGLDLLFVAEGVDGERLAPGGTLAADALADFLAEAGAHARYAAPRLV